MVNEGLLHAYLAIAILDSTILAGGLPVTVDGGAFCLLPLLVLLVQNREEIPFQIPSIQLRQFGELPWLIVVDIDDADVVVVVEFSDDLPAEIVLN